MYIRYNNSPDYGRSNAPLQNHYEHRNERPPQNQRSNNHQKAIPPQSHHHEVPKPPPKEEKKGFKNPLKFLPKEIYNPETHKFFGILSAEDILLIGLILIVLDSGCDDDMILALALGYILLSDYIDFGNILF